MELYPGLYSVNLYLSGDTITYNNVHMPLFHFYVMQITRDIFRFRNHLSPSLQQRVTRRL
jgi:ethanolamine utilization protein EutA (predicted chaperonin)